MERDFMGLNLKDSSMAFVKEEAAESSRDNFFAIGSGVPWPSSLSKVSAVPHFVPFNAALLDERPPRMVSDHPGCSGFMAASSPNVYDLNNRRPPAEFQTLHSSHLSDDVKMVPYCMGNPLFKNHFAAAGQNFPGAAMKQQFLGGIPVMTPHLVLLSSGYVAGTTDPRFKSAAPGAPAQLTIFYAGAVNMYDGICPEQAQAIMFMAGNGCIPNGVPQRVQVQTPASRVAAGDGSFMNKTMNVPPCSALSSPASVSSPSVGQSGLVSKDNGETKASKSLGFPNPTSSKVETPKTMHPAAIPQARKASLARFLEKRKERVMSVSPYLFSTRSGETAHSESNFGYSSATSRAGL